MIIAVLIALASIDVAPSDKAIGLKAKEFSLEDQFEQEWKWGSHWKGKPVVMVLGDWKGSDNTKSWTDPLTKRFKDKVQFVALADVSLAPSFVRGLIRSKFRDAYQYSILLDWDGSVFTYYKVQEGLPNVIFIDATGMVRLHTWGKGSSEHVESVANELEKML
jgi:hypothetical protein